MDRTLKQMIEGVLAGDDEAYTMLYQMYYPKAYAQALKLCRNDADAKDMAQEALFQAYRSLPQLKNLEYFEFWFYRIVANKCKKMFYRNRDALYDPDMLRRDALMEERVEYMPDKILDNELDKEVVHDLVFLLNEKQQEILQLYYFEEKSISEVSAILGIPEGTTKSRIFQARKHLKEKIDLYQRMQGRKLSFHLDFVMPSIICLIIMKLETFKLFKSTKFLQATQVVSLTSLAIVGTVSIAETITYVEHQQVKPPQVLVQKAPQTSDYVPISFPHVAYEEKAVTTPKSAYYTLISVVPQASDMKDISKETWSQLKPIVDALKTKQSRYLNGLTNNGWLSAFDNYHK